MVIPAVLVEVLRRREAVLVAGAACGALAGGPPWRALVEGLVARLTDRDEQRQARALAAGGRTAAALAALTERLGPQVAARVVATLASGERPLPPVLVALAAAPWRAVITTGFDAAWTRAHAAVGTRTVALTAGRPVDDEAAALDDELRLLVHVLGRAEDPETLCLGPADLRHHVVDTGLGDVLVDLARRYSFVFAGFEPGDPDLEWVAGRLIGAAGGDRQHFILCPGATALDVALLGAGEGLEAVETSAGTQEALAALAAAAGGASARRRPRRKRATSGLRVRAATRWRRAADTLERLAELDKDPDARAMYLYAAALIHRDRVGDRATASGLLDRALELDPALGPAWEALVHLVDSELAVADDGPAPDCAGAASPLFAPSPIKKQEPVPALTSELTDDERMLWATRMFVGARRGQA